MALVKFLGSDEAAAVDVALGEGETVLAGLERAGVAVPNSCRSGVCQSCLMQAEGAGAPPAESQKGLKESWRARGYFLACTCRPTADLTARLAGHAVQRARAIVKRVERLSHDVARVVLAHEGAFEYFPGQFVNVSRGDGLTRSYSLANLRDEAMELHVRRVANGQMSNWLHDEAREGETVELSGPMGDCFYVRGDLAQPMLLVGTGTGLAPLYAVAREALRHGHTGPIKLYHGALEARGLYLVDELLELQRRHANFSYTRCLMAGQEEVGVRVGKIDEIVLKDAAGKLKGTRVFLCGNPELVNLLRKRVFLAGAGMKDIYADAFVMRASA